MTKQFEWQKLKHHSSRTNGLFIFKSSSGVKMPNIEVSALNPVKVITNTSMRHNYNRQTKLNGRVKLNIFIYNTQAQNRSIISPHRIANKEKGSY